MKGNELIFRTASFSAEGRSVLHGGIYNRELSASLASGAVIVVSGLLLAGHLKITAPVFVAFVILFAALFMIFRMYIFREPSLEAVFDAGKGIITVSVRKGIRSISRSYPLNRLSDISLGHVTVQPRNIDGIEIVEKVALQHGTVIPGFGKKEDFYTVTLDFEGDKVVVFSGKERQGAEAVASELKKYIGSRYSVS